MKGEVAYLHGPKDLRLKDEEFGNIESNEILIQTKACGICGSDVECFLGESDEGRYDIAPYTPGHEWAGKVVEVGEDVGTIQKGDKVTGDCVLNCGVCKNCKDGLMPSACLNMRETGFRPDSPGAMGKYLVMQEQFVHKIPDEWSYEEGALVEPVSVGYFGIWGNEGYVDASDTVVILGAGMIGLSSLIVAKASNSKVIMVEPLKNRREKAANYGADVVLDPKSENLEEVVFNLTDDRGANLVVEASGNDEAIQSIFDIAGHSARVRLIGHSVGRKIPIEIGLTIWKTLDITGSGGTKKFMPRTIRFMDRIKDEVNFEGLISHRYEFEEIQDAFNFAVNETDKAIKVMLNFD